MRRTDFLAPLGLLVIAGSVAWSRLANRPLPGKPELYLILGGALILTHLVFRWEDVAGRLGRRQMKYGANTVVLSVVVLGILIAVNYLVYRHTRRWDLTKTKRYSLSDQTRKVVTSLKDDVAIWYFQRGDMQAGQDRLKEYQALSPRLKVQFVDPVAKPMTAQAHDARGPWPTLVIERGDKREKVSNDSEQDITNAIIKVTRTSKKTVCFAAGEGERDMEDSSERGLSGAKAALGRSQYETQKVFLAREADVPAACTVLVVAGPERDLLPPTIDAIRRYVQGGGKLLLMVEPEMKESFPNLDALAKEWTIDLGKDVVLDVSPMGQLFGTGPLTPLALEYPFHEITKDFRVATAFHTARSATANPGTERGTAGVMAQNLVQTAPASWAETDLTLKEPVGMDAGKDKKGPISLAAVVTVDVTTPPPSPSPAASAGPSPSATDPASPSPATSPSPAASPSPESETPVKREGRVAVFGDADFATNALLTFQGNQDFYLNTVAWLAEDAELISVRPREAEDQRMFLTQQQQTNVMWLSLVIVPGFFVVWGATSWWRRRA